MEIHGDCGVEVLVVDDASTDKTQDVVHALISQYGTDRVRYFRLSCNAGAQVARNRGILEARGEYIMFVDSDDVPIVSGISSLLDKLQTREDVEYAYGQVILTDVKLGALPNSAPLGSEWDGSSGELAGYHWHTMGAVYRRSCLEKVGCWDPELTGSQDWEFQARVKAFGGKGTFLPVIVGYWRQHDFGRVGADSFRPDYVNSAAKACCSIWKHSCHARKGTPLLAKRIARRLLRHALEWGAAGYSKSKLATIQRAMHIAICDKRTHSLLKVFKFTPQWVDRLIVQITDARSRLR
jgi:glycosyltransferase involved in cell wall biosynthesis